MPTIESPVTLDNAIAVENLRKSYYNTVSKQSQLVLNDVSFRAERGKVTILMGQSGCGKSTLFRILIGEEIADEGKVEILGSDVSPGAEPFTEEVKKKFGILFQSGALFNSMTVGDNIAFPILEHQPQLHSRIVDIMVQTKLRQVELDPDIYQYKMPTVLSGGERKRVSLARALALDPKLIFYDEPSAGLDPIVSRTIDQLIKDLVRVLDISSVVITHELDSAFAIADKMIILKRAVPEHNDDWVGTICYDEGTPDQLRNSKKPYTVEFLGEFSNFAICLKCRHVQEKDFKECRHCHEVVSVGL